MSGDNIWDSGVRGDLWGTKRMLPMGQAMAYQCPGCRDWQVEVHDDIHASFMEWERPLVDMKTLAHEACLAHLAECVPAVELFLADDDHDVQKWLMWSIPHATPKADFPRINLTVDRGVSGEPKPISREEMMRMLGMIRPQSS